MALGRPADERDAVRAGESTNVVWSKPRTGEGSVINPELSHVAARFNLGRMFRLP